MKAISLYTISGEHSRQMTVITLRINTVLIGIIKLGKATDAPGTVQGGKCQQEV